MSNLIVIHFIGIFIILTASLANAQTRGAGRANSTSSSISDRQFFGVGVGYSYPFELKFKSARLSGVGGESTILTEFESAPVLELDFRAMPKRSLYGLQAGVVIDFDHKNKSTSTLVNGVPNSNSGFEGSKLSVYTLEGSLAGRFERFFVTVGINYSVANFSASPNFMGTVSVNGGNSTQLGFGYFISDHYAIEFMFWRRKTFKFSSTSTSGVEDSFGLGDAVTSTIALKYFPKLLN